MPDRHDNGLTSLVNQCGFYTSSQAAYLLGTSSKTVREIAQRKSLAVPSYTIEWAGRTSYVFTDDDIGKMKEYLYDEDHHDPSKEE